MGQFGTINYKTVMGWMTNHPDLGHCNPWIYGNDPLWGVEAVYQADQDGQVHTNNPNFGLATPTDNYVGCGEGWLLKSNESALPSPLNPCVVISQLNVDMGRLQSTFPQEFEITDLISMTPTPTYHFNYEDGNGMYTMTTRFKNNKPTYENGNGWVIWWDSAKNQWSMTDKSIEWDIQLHNNSPLPDAGVWDCYAPRPPGFCQQSGRGPNSPTPTPTPWQYSDHPHREICLGKHPCNVGYVNGAPLTDDALAVNACGTYTLAGEWDGVGGPADSDKLYWKKVESGVATTLLHRTKTGQTLQWVVSYYLDEDVTPESPGVEGGMVAVGLLPWGGTMYNGFYAHSGNC